VVDDTPENLSLLGAVLERSYRVLVAKCGRRALELAQGTPSPDLILLDVMMPELDGYQVLERLRGEASTRDIPVIFVTAMNDVGDEERGLEHGAIDYIAKPIRPAIVLARIRTQLELKQARDRLRDDNTHLEAEIARRMGENQLTQEVSIRALARLAETRDLETGNHLLRTQEYVRTLARRIAVYPRFAALRVSGTIDLIARSAPLHDIGKVGIPDHVLRKPGPLSSEEWAIMKTHPQLGAEAIRQAERDAVRPVAFLNCAKEIARHHHERWDGRGYPDGLAGDAIPVSARLMAIADVFDAMVCRRVYKEPITFANARSLIAEDRGVRFDPDMVDAFLSGFEEFAAIAERYADTDDDIAEKIALASGDG